MMTFHIQSNVQNASILRCPPKQFDLLPYFKEEFGTPAWNAPVRKAISSPWTPIVHKNVSSSEHKSDCDDIDESPITSHTPVVKQVLQSPTHHTHDDDATFTLYPKPNESIIEEDDNDEYNNENNELEYFIAYPFNEETNQQFLILNDNKYHYKTNNGRKFYWYCRQEGCRGSLRTIRPHAYTTDATKPFGKIYYVREHTFDHEPTWSLQIAQKQATQHVLCWYICDVFLLFFFLCFHCFLFRRQYRIH
eukprot:544904_1